MSILNREIEELAAEAGLAIVEDDGDIKVWDMSIEDGQLVAWYYAGDFWEARSEKGAEVLPDHILNSDDAELLVEIIINEGV